MHRGRKPVYVSPDEASLLVDVIDLHIAGAMEARECTTNDPTIESFEELLDLISGYDDDMRRLKDLRGQLVRLKEEART